MEPVENNIDQTKIPNKKISNQNKTGTYTQKSRRFIREGGYGDVHKIIFYDKDPGAPRGSPRTTSAFEEARRFASEKRGSPRTKITKILAVKRNYVTNQTDFIGSIRELDFIAQLEHPHIVEYERVYKRDEMKIKENRNLVEYGPSDTIYIAMEYGIRDGISMMTDGRMGWKQKKQVILELLLGLEYMHNLDVAHLDIKVPNFIQIKGPDGIVRTKWCDFGTAIWYTKHNLNDTEKITTYAYRPPEIAFGRSDYDTKADIWSFGCVIIALLTRDELTFIDIDKSDVSNTVLARYLINRVPTKVTPDDLAYLDPRKKIIRKFDYKKRNAGRPSLYNIIKFEGRKKFDASPGSYNELLDLLSNIIILRPNKRWDAGQILKHSFFNFGRKYVAKINTGEPAKRRRNILVVTDKKLRKLTANYYRETFSDFGPRFHPYRVMFHALDIYDQAISHQLDQKLGELVHDDLVKVCGYLALKLIIDNYDINYFESTFGVKLSKRKYKLMEQLEYELVCNELNGKLYQDTLLEMTDMKLTDEDKGVLYDVYANLEEGEYALNKIKQTITQL